MKTKSYIVIAVVFLVIVVLGIFSAVFNPVTKGISVFSSKGSYQSTENEFYEYDADSVDSLDIDIEHGKITFEEGKSFSVRFNNMEKCNVKCKVENNTLIVSEERGGWHLSFNHDPECIITVPEGFRAVKTDITVNAGQMIAKNLRSESADINIDAGSCDIDNLETSGKLVMCVGAGSIDIANSNLADSSFECGAGEIIVNGSIVGNFDVNCGMGSSTFNLEGDADDYTFDIECGLGSVSLNGEEYGGNTDMTVTGEHSQYKSEVDCGLGEIVINTK